jgi:glucokinase
MTARPSVRVGVDIGGTKIRIGILDEAGGVLAATHVRTRSTEGAKANAAVVMDKLAWLLEDRGLEMTQVAFMGVGVPGTTDPYTGVVEYTPNLPWLDEPLGDVLSEMSSTPVLIAQDSRCAAWGELMFGAGRDFKSFLMVTVGTGIGSGIILDGRILSGEMNTAGELGHSILHLNGRLCACGNRGCLERYASGSAIGELGGQLFPEKFAGRPTAERVFDLVETGFGPAADLVGTAVDSLAQAIVNAVDLLSVPGVVISGGLCVHDELFVQPLRRKIEELAYFPWKRRNQLRVIRAELGTDAPMIGAAFLDRAFQITGPCSPPEGSDRQTTHRLELA